MFRSLGDSKDPFIRSCSLIGAMILRFPFIVGGGNIKGIVSFWLTTDKDFNSN